MADFLDKQLYVILSVPSASREELNRVLPEHLAHQVRLEKSGVMFAAGPLATESGAAGGGLIVIRARDFAEAKTIADSDPFHQSGLRTYTLWKWTVHEGSLSVRLNYSDQRFTVE